MNEVQKEVAAVSETTKRVVGNLIHTLADVGSIWAVHGLKAGSTALVATSETLGKTAHALDVMAAELEKKNAPPAEPPAAAPPVEPPAAAPPVEPAN